MYHSVATLTPNGTVMIAGSNPNLDRSEVNYGTEYRVEWLSPPYMTEQRPVIASGGPTQIPFGKTVEYKVTLPGGNSNLQGMSSFYTIQCLPNLPSDFERSHTHGSGVCNSRCACKFSHGISASLPVSGRANSHRDGTSQWQYLSPRAWMALRRQQWCSERGHQSDGGRRQ